MLVIIDNYDSFTYNLAQLFGELGEDVRVFRNDAITVRELDALDPAHIVISPGPGDPTEAGVSNEVICTLGPRRPLLGVCLGHQCIGAAFGGRIIRAPQLMHGKTSPIVPQRRRSFRGAAQPVRGDALSLPGGGRTPARCAQTGGLYRPPAS